MRQRRRRTNLLSLVLRSTQILQLAVTSVAGGWIMWTGHIFIRDAQMFRWMPVFYALYSLNNRTVPWFFCLRRDRDPCSLPPPSSLPPASVGHAVQTDQRSHDKERANTGSLSAASTGSQTTRGQQNHPRRRKKAKKKLLLESFFFSFSFRHMRKKRINRVR